MDTYTKIAIGAAKLGRTGTKLHKASLMRTTKADGTFADKWVVVCKCGCQGLKSVRGRVEFYLDAAPNCGSTH